jgi:hypothetical protein
MMADMIMGDKDVEEMQSVTMNIEVITLYTYKDYYLLEPNQKETKIKTNLTISRKNCELTERSTNS